MGHHSNGDNRDGVTIGMVTHKKHRSPAPGGAGLLVVNGYSKGVLELKAATFAGGEPVRGSADVSARESRQAGCQQRA